MKKALIACMNCLMDYLEYEEPTSPMVEAYKLAEEAIDAPEPFYYNFKVLGEDSYSAFVLQGRGKPVETMDALIHALSEHFSGWGEPDDDEMRIDTDKITAYFAENTKGFVFDFGIGKKEDGTNWEIVCEKTFNY